MAEASAAVRTLFRLMLKHARALERAGATLDMRMPMDTSAWLGSGGGHGWSKPIPEYRVDALSRLLPWVASTGGGHTGSFSPSQLRGAVRRQFRAPPPPGPGAPAAGGQPPADLLDRGLASLRILEEQRHMAARSSQAVTQGVHVEVTTEFLGLQRDLDPMYDDEGQPPKYIFTYRVRVSNVGQDTVQLLGRHWLIEDARGGVTEVPRGSAGVVGCTPILKPGTCFQYYSGTDLDTPSGTMRGSFQMAELDPVHKTPVREFDAEIGQFSFLSGLAALPDGQDGELEAE